MLRIPHKFFEGSSAKTELEEKNPEFHTMLHGYAHPGFRMCIYKSV